MSRPDNWTTPEFIQELGAVEAANALEDWTDLVRETRPDFGTHPLVRPIMLQALHIGFMRGYIMALKLMSDPE